jgi:competence protein ComEA
MRPQVYLFLAFLVLMLGATIAFKVARPLDTHRVEPVSTNYRIDINTADAPALALLPGVGPQIAQRIIDHRQRRGGFTKVEDLNDVPGIGDKTLERMSPYITCSPRDPGARSAR